MKKNNLRRGLITEVINFLHNNEEAAFNAAGYHTWVEDIIVGGKPYGSYYELFKDNLKQIKKGTDLGVIAFAELPNSGYVQYGTEISLWSEMTSRGLLICIEIKQPYTEEDGWTYQGDAVQYFFM